MADKRRLFNKDDQLRQKAIKLALQFMQDRKAGDLKAMHDQFKACYKDIYEFISNKPYH